MSRASISSAVLLGLGLLAACAASDDPTGETSADATTGELRVRVGELTLWVDRKVTVASDAGVPVATIHARTSRNLVNVLSYVPDDAFGEATIVGPRSFDIDLRGGHELNTILSGLSLLVSIDVTTGTPTHYDARLDLEPGLFDFRGSGAVFVDGSLRPVYAGTSADPLRYRAGAETASASLTVVNGGTPTVSPVSGGFDIDWTYTDLDTLLATAARVSFQLADATKKSARAEVRTTAIDLTTGDPYQVWATACEPDVFACVGSADDLTTCGDYRDVQRCLYADPCEVNGSSPLVLDELDLSFVWESQLDTYLDGCVVGGDWCSVQTLQAYTMPECLAEPATLAAIVGLLLDGDQDWGGVAFSDGTVLDRDGLRATPLFSGSYSPGGPALLDAIDAHMATGPLEAWKLTQEVPCHNCHDFRDVYVLYYPEAFRVVLVKAGHGYDS